MSDSDDEYFYENLLPPDSPEPSAASDSQAEKESEKESPAGPSNDVTTLTLALGALATGAVTPKRQFTMLEEIERLSEENAKIYHEKLLELTELHNINLSSTDTDPSSQRTGALEHISAYTKEQSVRFQAMVEAWRQIKDLKAMEDAENQKVKKQEPEKHEICIEPPLVDTVTGHYGIYQITCLGTSYLNATPVHDSLKNSGKVQINRDSLIVSENGSCYLMSIENLLLGDTIAVKELDKSVVKKFCVFKRRILENQTFSIGKTKRPVIMGTGEVGAAKDFLIGTTHIGEIFFPVNWNGPDRNVYLPIAQPVVLKYEKDAKSCRAEQFYNQTRYCKYSPESLDYLVAMGSSAMTAARVGVFDPIRYSIDSSKIKLDNGIIRILIPPPATSRTWVPGTRVAIEGAGQAVITYVPENNKYAVISVKPIGEFNYAILSSKALVYQMPMEHVTPIQRGFFENMEDGTNGKRVIQTLFGGSAIGVDGEDQKRIGFMSREDMNSVPFPECQPVLPDDKVAAYPATLDTPQATYIHQLVTGALPITVGNFPILSGKTTAVAIAALEAAKANPGTQHLVYVPDDQGAKILVDRMQSVLAGASQSSEEIKALRMICFKDWMNLTPIERSSLDYPVMLRKFLEDIIEGKYDLDEDTKKRAELYYGKETDDDTFWRNLFFSLVSPQIIIGKFQSILPYFPVFNNVTTIQLDDADQIPQHDLIRTCIQFPSARYGLMGDAVKEIKYFPGMTGFQASPAIGKLVEMSVNWKLFPIVTSKNVYGGVNSKITDVIGEVYYKDRQLVGHAEPGNSGAPAIRILHHHMFGPAKDAREIDLLMKLVRKLTSAPGNRPLSEIGVLCFTHGYIPLLHQAFQGSGVYTGYYDAFHGIQKEILIIWGGFSAFRESGLSMNLTTFMLTRGTQMVYILGNTQDMVNMKNNGVKWKTLVQVVRANGGGVWNAEQFIEGH